MAKQTLHCCDMIDSMIDGYQSQVGGLFETYLAMSNFAAIKRERDTGMSRSEVLNVLSAHGLAATATL